MKNIKDIKLRNIGGKHMLVDASHDNVNMADVYTLNDTAAYLWQMLDYGTTSIPMLAQQMSQHFDVKPDTAARDIERQLSEWQSQGLLEQ